MQINEHPDLVLPDAAAVVQYLLSAYEPELHENTTFTVTLRSSPHANYYTVHQNYTGLIIRDAVLKICTDRSGRCKWIKGDLANTAAWSTDNISLYKKIIPADIASRYHLSPAISGTAILQLSQYNEPELLWRFTDTAEAYASLSLIINERSEIIEMDDHRAYFTLSDSSVTGKVFLPDPVTSADTVYGGNYTDEADADNDHLNSERYPVIFTAEYADGTFYLQNDHITLKDFAAPVVPVVTSTLPVFDFTRAEAAFEDVNAFYHITNFDAYISELGYDTLMDFYIELDTHAASGADQSFFTSAAILNIQYGEGGVDDAEDADVIIHEYTHALSYHAAPESNSGFERRAVDEGYGDYMAVSYSRSYSDHNWQNVFSWDGHNEFWSGRNANTSKHYPEDMSADYYACSEIWSGALMDIYDAIGKANTDKLVCESLYGSIADMSMPDAAQIVLNAEDLLFAGIYHEIVFNILDARGLIPDVEIAAYPNKQMISITNTFGAAYSGEPLHIQLADASTASLTITDVQGRIMYNTLFRGHEYFLQIPELPSGIYFLSVRTENAYSTEKILIL